MKTPADKLDRLFRDFTRSGAPGLSAMVIRSGEPIVARADGWADLDAPTPCRLTTNYRLASLTKAFTAMAVLRLAERKQLALTDRLTDFFPEFPPIGGRITLRHLLHHTAGVLDYEDLLPEGTRLAVSDRDVLRLLLPHDRTRFRPGARFRYSNSGYALLALVVEVVSGHTFAAFLQRHIFGPLGMTGSVAYEAGLSTVAERAFGHSRRGAGFARTDQSLTSSVLGDGGIYSSVADLFRWDQALYGEGLVSRATLRQVFTPGPATTLAGTGYGFGWFLDHRHGAKRVWHYGDTVGFTTRIERFPERQFTVILLANRSDAPLAALARAIRDLFLPR